LNEKIETGMIIQRQYHENVDDPVSNSCDYYEWCSREAKYLSDVWPTEHDDVI
jgi:hypothetical protein